LFTLLKNQQWPHWMHIVADEAYSPLSTECSGQILIPYCQHLLKAAKQMDWQNQQNWEDCMAHISALFIDKPIDHELNSERIAIE
jgi:hypothetical protein